MLKYNNMKSYWYPILVIVLVFVFWGFKHLSRPAKIPDGGPAMNVGKAPQSAPVFPPCDTKDCLKG